ncbi:hypothetical protein NCCP2716_27790 [Sporosarcina sp. NCCP-2716]|uniref:DUF3383 family protein n=1 Tax=Sporosarcina sp. NCCP-2716 TaxID=2943679 RepID=UPI002041E938|nr:DUF3383 family protein [Sporosarcina sp. NCCP-2716]GKV70281.1 hypothetical protein NCCP2716_27790 [Sporosarcina sp. NCCP-2716]
MALKDVSVVIDILHPASVAGLGRPLILVAGDAVKYTEYKGLETLVADFNSGTPTYKLAQTILAQKNKPEVICVATYVGTTPAPGQALGDVLEKYYDKSWHFALLAESTAADRLVLSNKVELHDFKFAVVQVSDKAEIQAFKGNPHTLVYFHTNEEERLDGAVIGDAANLEVGSITWKFRRNLKAVTPIEISPDDLDTVHTAGANAYVTKAGIPQTSEGIVATGEYIDFYHGRDWIKANMETDLQTMLADNDKVPSNTNGVSMVGAIATSVLSTAGKQGIIETNDEDQYAFNVYTQPYDEGTVDEQGKRVYSGLSFDYRAQGAIHKINVRGSVVSGA